MLESILLGLDKTLGFKIGRIKYANLQFLIETQYNLSRCAVVKPTSLPWILTDEIKLDLNIVNVRYQMGKENVRITLQTPRNLLSLDQ